MVVGHLPSLSNVTEIEQSQGKLQAVFLYIFHILTLFPDWFPEGNDLL